MTVSAKGVNLSDDPENDSGDAEDFSKAPVFGALGVTCMPFHKTEQGNAQALVCRYGDGIIAGMRDTRIASLVGVMKPGDTCMHSTGDKHNARIFLKEETNAVVAISKDSQGKDMMFSLGGTDDTASIQARGCVLQFSDEGIVLGFKGNQIVISANGITIGGKQVILGSGAPTFAVVGAVPTAPGQPILCAAPGSPTVPPAAVSGSVFLTT